MRQRRTQHIDQGITPRRRHNNCTYLFTKHRNITIYRANTAAAAAKSLQSCLTLCDPRDRSPPDFLIPGILQARTLEWVATSFSSA